MDVRVGGSYRFGMRSPEGTDYWKHGMFRELVEPERIVFTFAWENADPTISHELLTTVTLEEQGQKTRLTLRQTGFPTIERRDDHRQGWTSCLGRFAEYIADNQKDKAMQHRVVSREEWLAARKELLREEKEFTRLRDRLSERRRDLPWVKVDKTLCLRRPRRPPNSRRPVRRTQPACRQALHVRPGLDRRLRGLFVRDGPRARHPVHLAITMSPMLRSPVHRWRRSRHSSAAWAGTSVVVLCASDFNYDFHVSFRPEQIAGGKIIYNYAMQPAVSDELSGRSVFYKDEAGQIFHTYSSYARGGELFLGSYAILDITPKGRDETIHGNLTDWVRHHDRYEESTSCCCHG